MSSALSGTYALGSVAHHVSMSTGTQVCRFFSPGNNVHFCSSDPAEINPARANLGHIWHIEEPAYLVGRRGQAHHEG